MSGIPFLRFKTALRWLPGKKPTLFFPSFSENHRVSLNTQTIMSDRSHPRHFLVKRKYDEKERNSLWWAPTVTLAISPKRTVRTWCMRRLRAAFKEELEARGLNERAQKVRDGKVVDGPAAILGTLIMQTNATLVTAKYGKVREEAGWTVDALLAAFNPPQSSPPPNPRGGKPQMLRPGTKGGQSAGKGRREAPRKRP